jgi:hypothetical protein
MPSPSEQRQHPRVPMSHPMELIIENERLRGTLTDGSVAGLGLGSLDRPLEVGTKGKIILLVGDRDVEADVVVRRSQGEDRAGVEVVKPSRRLWIAGYIIVPLLTAGLGSAGTIMQIKGQPPKPAASTVPQQEASLVDRIHDPDYDGVHIVKDIRVVDLRSRIPVPPEKRTTAKLSPVTWTRYILVKRLSPEKKFMEVEFSTTGFGIDPRCITHKYEVITTRSPHIHGAREVKPYVLKIDISNEPLGKEFLIINEATYWNAFTGEREEWAGMHAEQDETIALVLLFPEEKPFTSFNTYEYQRGQKPEVFRGPSQVYQSEKRQVFFWKIEEPKKGFSYDVKWDW